MIFSLLNVRKKTAAALAGIAIAAASLWGLSMWQDIPMAELLQTLLAIVVMLAAIMVAAVLIIVCFKLLMRLLGKSSASDQDRAE